MCCCCCGRSTLSQCLEKESHENVFGILTSFCWIGLFVAGFIMQIILVVGTDFLKTTDETLLSWITATCPLYGLFEFFMYDDLWDAYSEGRISAMMFGIFSMLFLLKIGLSFFIYYNLLSDWLCVGSEYMYTENSITTTVSIGLTIFFVWFAIWSLLILPIVGGEYFRNSCPTNGPVCSSITEWNDHYDEACASNSDASSELYGITLFLAPLVLSIIYPVEIYIEGEFDKCDNTPMIPLIWGCFVASVSFIVIMVFLCLDCCEHCKCKESIRPAAQPAPSPTSDSVDTQAVAVAVPVAVDSRVSCTCCCFSCHTM